VISAPRHSRIAHTQPLKSHHEDPAEFASQAQSQGIKHRKTNPEKSSRLPALHPRQLPDRPVKVLKTRRLIRLRRQAWTNLLSPLVLLFANGLVALQSQRFGTTPQNQIRKLLPRAVLCLIKPSRQLPHEARIGFLQGGDVTQIPTLQFPDRYAKAGGRSRTTLIKHRIQFLAKGLQTSVVKVTDDDNTQLLV
jgi:hypothetical protein